MPRHTLSPYGRPKSKSDGTILPASVATLTELKAIVAGDSDRTSGNEIRVSADGSLFYWHATSTLTGDDIFVVTPADAPAAGRWLRAPGAMVDLSLPFTFNTADAAVLATLPTGARLLVVRGYWEIAADMTGGTSSTIGLSSGQSPHNTKGDLLGGGSGDAAASLTAGVRTGTIGADVAAGALLIAAATIRFDRITSAFTAGSGNAHLVGMLLANPGA